MRIAVVAGEHSGDALGAPLIQSLKQTFPEAEIFGVAGPKMKAAGCEALFSIDSLSVMGLWEIVCQLPRLLRFRKEVLQTLLARKPDLFIGIDAPEFNLWLEKKLKAQGVKIVHYVSPQVWAWRQYRMKKMQFIDRMLVLFPFEVGFYEKTGIPVTFVGHPLAHEIPIELDMATAREALGLKATDNVLAVLPGSRKGEIESLADVFLSAAKELSETPAMQPLQIVIPAATEAIFSVLQEKVKTLQLQNVHVVLRQSHQVLAAADVVLLASGTATLEAMLFKRPGVVAYRVSPITYFLAQYLVKVSFISLPNLLAGEMLYPELIQDAATSEAISQQILRQFAQKDDYAKKQKFYKVHEFLRSSSDRAALDAVLEVLQ